MLTVDLGRLFRTGGLEIDAELDVRAVDRDGAEALPAGPLRVRLDVRPAGSDIVARGEVEGVVEGECRRCLGPARERVREDVSIVYRRDAEPDDPDSYPLPERGSTLDLWPAVREQWLLAAPAFLECDAACRGLCPHCGADRNEEDCGCEAKAADERWGPLLALAGEHASHMNDEVADGRSEEEGIEAEKA
jgi:uncharacterized protein